MTKKFYRLNQYINAPKVRVIDDTGKQLGILPIGEALNLARSKRMDLIEVAEKAQPPVCKVIDFKKFRYLEAKKQQEEKKKSKKVDLKEVHLTPFIAENDLKFRLRRAEEFLAEGNKVKIAVIFRGRQMARRDFGFELIKSAVKNLAHCSKPENEAKFMGRQLEIMLSPLGKGKNETKNENQKIGPKEA